MPYGTTQCKWDTIIPLEPMWEQLKRVIKPNGAIVMTASQPFTTTLIASNMKMFRYCWVWVKTKASNFQNARKMPMKRHEDILVFYDKLPTYNHYANLLEKPVKSSRKNKGANLGHCVDSGGYIQKEGGFPTSDIYYANPSGRGHLHPTQKPVLLMEYLIKTYTNEGETVLDFTMGSGTTGVACKNLNRDFIGIELDEKYFEIAKQRIEGTQYNHQINRTQKAAPVI
ncbi:MAG: site-specific DNA-methyltransferase [Bacteroidota bacterium]